MGVGLAGCFLDVVLIASAEDEPQEPNKDDEDDDDDDPINPLVDALFDEIEHLRYQVRTFSMLCTSLCSQKTVLQLFESEMRCAMVEAETREEVMQEMEERMQHMEAVYARRLMREVSFSLYASNGDPFLTQGLPRSWSRANPRPTRRLTCSISRVYLEALLRAAGVPLSKKAFQRKKRMSR